MHACGVAVAASIAAVALASAAAVLVSVAAASVSVSDAVAALAAAAVSVGLAVLAVLASVSVLFNRLGFWKLPKKILIYKKKLPLHGLVPQGLFFAVFIILDKSSYIN